MPATGPVNVRTGNLAPWNFHASPPGSSGQEQAVHAAGAIAQNALSPFAAVARIGADPIGGAAGYLGGAFNYGVPTDRMRQITHAINAAYAPAIKAARAQGNTGRVQELMQQRDAQVQARLREDQQVP